MTQRTDLAIGIRDAAVRAIKESGELVEVGGTSGRHPQVKIGGLTILYTTPFNPPPSHPELFGPQRPPYGIDIWEDNGGKVFSALWDPFEIVSFKRGPWVKYLLNLAS